MGFYGNINNTVKVQFNFDRIFSSRSAMVEAVENGTDAVFAGRFVLVSYDKEVYDFPIYYLSAGKIYSNMTDAERQENEVTLPQGTIIHVPMEHDLDNVSLTRYYFINENSELEIVAEGNLDNPYLINYLIDTRQFGAGRGYDGTVWQKMYADGAPYFAMVAELNSIVPTLAITADAPTVIPRAPHFDVDTSNVYYKLHIQSNPGLWIKPAKYDGNITVGTDVWSDEVGTSSKEELNYPSDVTYHYPRRQYDGSMRPETNARAAAMYFNKAGFDAKYITYAGDVAAEDAEHQLKNIWEYDNRTGKYQPEDNITIDLNGISGQLYGVDGSVNRTAQPDTNEVAIMLPSIGDTIASVWDLVYGGRDVLGKEATTRNLDINWEDAGSTQHRLGLRLTKETGHGIGYAQDEVNTIAGSINTVHDLIGMIVVDATSDDFNFKSADAIETADIDKIYWYSDDEVGERYYRVGIEYSPQYDEENASNNKNPLPHFEPTDVHEPIPAAYFDKYGENYLLVRNASDFKKNKKYYQWVNTETNQPTLRSSFTQVDVPPEGYVKDTYYYMEGDDYILDTNELPTAGRQYYKIPATAWQRVANGASIIWFAANRFYKLEMTTPQDGSLPEPTGQIILDTDSSWVPDPQNNHHYELYLIETNALGQDSVYINVTHRVRKLDVDGPYYTYDAASHRYSRVTSDIYENIWSNDSDTGTSGSAAQHTLSDIEGISLQLWTLGDTQPISLYAPGTYYYVSNPIVTEDNNNSLIIKMDGEDTPVIGDIIKDKSYIKTADRTYFAKTKDPEKTKYSFYIPGEYYLRDAQNGNITGDDGQSYLLSNEGYGVNNDTHYYERFNKHVMFDENNIFPQYLEWNPNIDVPDGVQLCWLKDKQVFEELEGYARDKNTLNGLLLETHKLFGADDTRDTDTVHGAINTLKDLTNNFATVKAGETVVIDHYGRMHSAPIRGDDWTSIVLDDDVDEPTVTITHLKKDVVNETAADTTDLSTSTTATVQLQDLAFDAMGHVNEDHAHTYNLPYNFGKIQIDNNTTDVIQPDNTFDTLTLTGDSWVQLTPTPGTDTVAFTHIGPVAVTHQAVSNDTPAFGSTFTIQDWTFDAKGHKTSSGTHTVMIPKGSYVNTPATTGATGVITGLGFTDTTGAITSTSNYLGAITLGSYTAPAGGNGIDTSTTLAAAIATLDNRIYTEEQARINAVNAEEQARMAAINALDYTSPAVDGSTSIQFITSVSQEDGRISATKSTVPTASITTPGIVQLSNSLESSSETTAATSKAVNDLATSKVTANAALAQAGTTRQLVTYDTKGLVTGGSALIWDDISSLITWDRLKLMNVGEDINHNPITLETVINYIVEQNQSALTPPKELTGIRVTTLPQTTYTSGDLLNLTGMVVTADYSGGWPSESISSGYAATPADGTELTTTDTATNIPVTITYNGKTATFSVTVNPASTDPENPDAGE